MRSQQEELIKNRKLYLQTKRKNIFSRFKCKHEYLYLGIDNSQKIYFCKKCGKEEYC